MKLPSAVAVAVLAPALLAQYGVTERVSRSVTGQPVGAASGWPSLSDDGRFVAFESRSGELVLGDLNGMIDVFLLDRASSRVARVSVGLGAQEANSHSFTPSLSADGGRVAFASVAWNLVPGSTNGHDQIYVVDTATLATVRVSSGPQGGPGNSPSSYPALSGDGRCVAFESWATNLDPGDTSGQADVFWHDTATGVTKLASRTPSGRSGNGDSGGDAHDGPAISHDGRWVAFWSGASDLVPNDVNGIPSGPPPYCLTCGDDVFVFDALTNAVTRVSVTPSGADGNDGSYHPSISGDGRFVAFNSGANNFVPGDTNGFDDLFVHDRDADQDGVYDEPGAIAVVRANVTSSGAQSGGIGYGGFGWGGPAISRDGTRVAFMSHFTDLTTLAPNGKYNVYVHDLITGETAATCVTPAGALDAENSFQPAIDGTGRHVAFASSNASLVAGDSDSFQDVFLRTFATSPQSYCTAQTNSLGCTPAIGSSGVASASVASSFSISAVNLRNNVAALLLYSHAGAATTPLAGGTLCVRQPLVRTPALQTRGSAAGADCTGSLSFDFAAWITSGADPALTDGAPVWAQVWSRDGGSAFGTNLSDALSFSLLVP